MLLESNCIWSGESLRLNWFALRKLTFSSIWTVQPRSDCLSDSPLLSNYFPAAWKYYSREILLINFWQKTIKMLLFIHTFENLLSLMGETNWRVTLSRGHTFNLHFSPFFQWVKCELPDLLNAHFTMYVWMKEVDIFTGHYENEIFKLLT